MFSVQVGAKSFVVFCKEAAETLADAASMRALAAAAAIVGECDESQAAIEWSQELTTQALNAESDYCAGAEFYVRPVASY